MRAWHVYPLPGPAFRRMGPDARRTLAKQRRSAVRALQAAQPATVWTVDTDESADWHRQVLLDALGYPEGCIVRHCTGARRARGLCDGHLRALYRGKATA